MKAHIITLVILDRDTIGETGVRNAIEDTKYPNRCISPRVTRIETFEIGEWHDDHPLNRLQAPDAEKWLRDGSK